MCLRIVASLALFCLVAGSGGASAQNILEPPHPDDDPYPHYPDDQEAVNPIDPEADMDSSFPKRDSVFGRVRPEDGYFNWKKGLYESTGIKLAFNYTSIVQVAPQSQLVSDSVENVAAGGWFQAESLWKYNKDEDYEGSFTVVLDARHPWGSSILPGDNFQSNGSLYGLDATFLEWDLHFQQFFWEQHVKKGTFSFRLGQIAAPAVLDFNRFKDARVSYNNTNFVAIPVHVFPMPPPGFGAAFRWNPIRESGFYVAGSVNDVNVVGGEVDWSNLDEGEIFAGIELGNIWQRGPGDFDDAHVTLFYADEASTAGVTVQNQFVPWPQEAGWGFKVHGSKQWDRIVTFANYTFTTNEGGHVGVFGSAQHATNLGLVYLQPGGIQGEIGFGFNVSQINPNRARIVNDPQNPSEALLSGLWGGFARTSPQYGAEIYWKILMMPSLWVTPGIQFIVDPTFNERSDFIIAPHVKARLFF